MHWIFAVSVKTELIRENFRAMIFRLNKSASIGVLRLLVLNRHTKPMCFAGSVNLIVVLLRWQINLKKIIKNPLWSQQTSMPSENCLNFIVKWLNARFRHHYVLVWLVYIRFSMNIFPWKNVCPLKRPHESLVDKNA